MSQNAAHSSGIQAAVLTCMDHRLDPPAILGLAARQLHVVRNAGGYVTDDAIRSLCLSQTLVGTSRIVVVHHTDCAASKDTAEGYRAMVEASTGVSPTWDVDPVGDPRERVLAAMEQLRASPLLDTSLLEGFVYDVEDASLTPVE